MNERQLALALKKQRLQIKSDALREQWQQHARGLAPTLAVADQVRAGIGWLKQHPEVTVGAGVALAVAKPRAVWRWLRRGFTVWQVWRKGQRWLAR